MFTHSSNVKIWGGNFTTTGSTNYTAFEKLQNVCAPSAFHNSSTRFDPPKCHPNTRVAILEYLMGWIFGRNEPEALILWLYGPAGAGKSAILQTLAERCFERKLLLASFFFGRSDPTRNTFRPLVATIAYQIATIYPETKPHLESVVERDPLIFDKSIATQLQSLVVDPLKALAASGFFNDANPWVRLILIDGLDECDDPRMQSTILRALANMLRNENLPLIFLIASRPEQHLTLTFNSSPLAGLWRSLVLDGSHKPDDDIRLFLKDSFQEIRTTHPLRSLIPALWPEPSDLETLIQKSSGQFIYASVVVKYVSAPIDRPHRRLEVILGLRPARRDLPFSELDALYMHILGSCPDPDTVLSILGLMCAKFTMAAADDIEFLLDLEPGDLAIALSPLASICHFPDGPDQVDSYTHFYHASFGDFLLDISRSGPFYIDLLIVHETIVSKCLAKLMDPSHFCSHIPLWLANILKETLIVTPLTETVKSVLNNFSLQQYWLSLVAGPDNFGQETRYMPLYVILLFLDALKTNCSHSEYSTIYASHVSSFESLIKSELPKYYEDVGLTALAVMAMVRIHKTERNLETTDEYEYAVYTLLQLSEEACVFDESTLYLVCPVGKFLLEDHYHYLVLGPDKAPEVCLNAEQHAQTALQMLRFLCDPSHYPGRPRYVLQPHRARTNQVTRPGFARLRREKKHRYGVALLFRPKSEVFKACRLGQLYLPTILERSSIAIELVGYILERGKDLAYVPGETRKVIRAMYVYLIRAQEELSMVID